MAAIDYIRLQNDAETAIDDNGRDITLIKGNRTAIDPSKPWRGAVDLPLETTGTTIKAIFLPASGSKLTRRTEAGELQLHKADRDEFLLAGKVVVANAIDLTEFDFVQDGTLIWRIVSVSEEKPGPLSLLFHVVVER